MVRLNTPLYTAQLPQENNRIAPAGKYLCLLKKADLKDNSNKTGQIIEVIWSIFEGNYKGVGAFDSINISNPNPVAVEIGLARLNSILTIAGMNELHDTDDLVRANIIALVTFGVDEYNGKEKNTVIKIESPSQPQAQPRPPFQVQQPMQAPQTQQSWQQPQPQAQTMQWGQPQAQPQRQAPTIQSTQDMLNDKIPF